MGRKSKQAGGNMPLTHYERTKKFASSEYGTIRCRLAGHSQYQIGYCALSITRIGDVDNSSSNSNSNSISTSISTTIASHTKQQQQQQQIVIAMCTPSGYLYSEQAILEYMLHKTQEIKERKKLQEQQKQQQQQQQQHNEQQQQHNRVSHDQLMLLSTDNNNVDNNKDINTNNTFLEAQKVIKKRKLTNDKQIAQNDLQRTSYWLATVVPEQQQKQHPQQPNDNTNINTNTPSDDIEDRPGSPCTDQPIRRKDIWPVQLVWNDNKVVCGISQKTIQSQQAIAYWVDKTIPGTIVIESVYNDILMIKKSTSSASAYVSTSTNDSNVVDTCTSSSSIVSKGDRNNDKSMIPKCPLTGKKIKYIRTLQKSGSSFASSGQTVQVKQYRPTIT